MLLDHTAFKKNAVIKFKEMIPSSFNSMLCVNTEESSYLNFTPLSLLTYLIDNAAALLCKNTIAFLNKKVVNQRRLAPWQNRSLKQTSQKLDRRWCSTNLEESHLAWKDNNIIFKKVLPKVLMTLQRLYALYSKLVSQN